MHKSHVVHSILISLIKIIHKAVIAFMFILTFIAFYFLLFIMKYAYVMTLLWRHNGSDGS